MDGLHEPLPPLPGALLPIEYVRPLLCALERFEGELREVWKVARLRTPLREVQNSKVCALPVGEFLQFYQFGVERLEQLCCERDGVHAYGPQAGNVLLYSLISGPDIRSALARFCDLYGVLSGTDASRLLFVADGSEAVFSLPSEFTTRDECTLLVDAIALHFVIGIVSWLLDRKLRISSIILGYERPAAPNPILTAFAAPLTFESGAKNAIIFRASELDQPITRSFSELETVAPHFPFNFIARTIPEGSTAGQVRLMMANAIRSSLALPSSRTVASLLNISTPTLRRRLRGETTSYAQIRAEFQRETAEHLLLNSALTLSDIAERVGYADDRALRRAFKAWTGKSPSMLRNARLI